MCHLIRVSHWSVNDLGPLKHDITFCNIDTPPLLLTHSYKIHCHGDVDSINFLVVSTLSDAHVFPPPPPPHCATVDDASLEGEESATDWSESSETDQ